MYPFLHLSKNGHIWKRSGELLLDNTPLVSRNEEVFNEEGASVMNNTALLRPDDRLVFRRKQVQTASGLSVDGGVFEFTLESPGNFTVVSSAASKSVEIRYAVGLVRRGAELDSAGFFELLAGTLATTSSSAAAQSGGMTVSPSEAEADDDGHSLKLMCAAGGVTTVGELAATQLSGCALDVSRTDYVVAVVVEYGPPYGAIEYYVLRVWARVTTPRVTTLGNGIGFGTDIA